MRKVISGLTLIVFGCLTLILWWGKLLQILLGLTPLIFIIVGMLVLSSGIRQIESRKMKNKSGIRTVKEKLSQKKDHQNVS